MQNEDKRLMEMATRAAGLDLEWCEQWKCMAKNLGVLDGFDWDTCWNPLQDDGDALRLAVITDQVVTINRVDEFTSVQCGYFGEITVKEEFAGCKFAATRRAITRAAAAMAEK